MKKRTFGTNEEIIIEAELARLLNRSAQNELSLEDVKKLDMLLKSKKIILEREDVQEPEDVTPPTKGLTATELLQIAEGNSEDASEES